MKDHMKRRKICTSWYHQTWFRVVLIIVGFDLVILGFAFAIGIDLVAITNHFSPIVRIVFGLMYVLAALFLIHYSLAYNKIKSMSHLVCHHCLHAACEDDSLVDKKKEA